MTKIHPILLTLLMAGAALAQFEPLTRGLGYQAQSGGGGGGSPASSLPLVHSSDFTYLGSFPLPSQATNPYPLGAGDFSQSNFSYAGGWITVGPGGNTLYVGGMDNGGYVTSSDAAGTIGLVNIPSDLSGATTATINKYLNYSLANQQVLWPIMNLYKYGNTFAALEGGAAYLAALNRLVLLYYWYWTTPGGDETRNVVTLPADFSSPPTFNLSVGTETDNRKRAGGIGTIGPEWAAVLGATHVSGQQQISTDQDVSFGPGVFAFNGADVGNVNPTPTKTLVFYPLSHPIDNYFTDFLPSALQSNVDYNATEFNPPGTRTLVVLASHGLAAYCYGTGSANGAVFSGTVSSGAPNQITSVAVTSGAFNPSNLANTRINGPGLGNNTTMVRSLVGATLTLSTRATSFGTNELFTVVETNTANCYDPANSAHGEHSFPYVYYAWLYDLNDLLRVKNRTEGSWVPRPYTTLTLPRPSTVRYGYAQSIVGSATYDPNTGRIYWYTNQAGSTQYINVWTLPKYE